MAVERTENIGWPCKKKNSTSSFRLTHSLAPKNKTHIFNLTLTCLILPPFVFQYIHFPSKTHNFPSAATVVVMVSLPKRVLPWLHRTEGAGNVPSWPHHGWSHPAGLMCGGGLFRPLELRACDQLKLWCGWRMTNSRFGGNLQLEARVNSRVMSQWHHLQVVNRRSTLRTT